MFLIHPNSSDEIGAYPTSSIHPPHLLDPMGRNLPAALIPFCSYQGDRALFGRRMEGFNFATCDKFQPTVMEGQLCYSLDVNNITRGRTKPGKGMGLSLLLDPINPKSVQNGVDHSFRIFLNTLDGFSDMKDGSYRMINVKKMVGTDSFMALSDQDKECQDKTLQDCSALFFLEGIKQSCNCVPWALNHALKVGFFLIVGVFSTQMLCYSKSSCRCPLPLITAHQVV